MLKLIDLIKEYKVDEESVLALHGVSIQFRRNEFVSILGPSGCGKTTLLNLIGGLDEYTSGDIVIDQISTKEYDDGDWDTYRNHRIGFIFQSYNLIPHMNILKNVAMSLTLAGVSTQERKKRALEALKKVGLDAQARKKPNQLSGGQMQRVAIARALVNDPEIILADEPTGALDSESGIQVMELLKEVAKDRLVIMVTHNPQLAEQYSTRIVSLKDGEVVGDTMPYNEDEDPEAIEFYKNLNERRLGQIAEYEAKHGNKKLTKNKIRSLKNRLADKSAMSLNTAISLSFTNLISKKGRTFLTSLAGSIGIIGIILVLAASSGVSGYVHTIEENALSKYPITIGESEMDIQTVLNLLMPEIKKSYPNVNELRAKKVLGNLIPALPTITGDNDLASLKKYIEQDGVFDHSWGQVKYDYGVEFNVFCDYAYKYAMSEDEKALVDAQEQAAWDAELAAAKTGTGHGGYSKTQEKYAYEKVYPFTDVMGTMFDLVMDDSSVISQFYPYVEDFAGQVESWDEISTNQALLDSQYTVMEGRWPNQESKTEGYKEVVLVTDENNEIPDYALFMLGLIPGNQVMEFMDPNIDKTSSWKVDFKTLIDKLEYKIISDADYLYYDKLDEVGNPTYSLANNQTRNKHWLEQEVNTEIDPENLTDVEKDSLLKGSLNSPDPITVKVVGVVRPKKGVNATSINGIIGYTKGLTEAVIEKAGNHPVVKAQIEEYQRDNDDFKSIINIDGVIKDKGNKYDVVAGHYYPGNLENILPTNHKGQALMTSMMRSLGFANLDKPISISFYCSSFHAKDKIIDMLDNYEDEVKYTDYLAIMMGYVSTLTDVVTYVLVGFSSISLVVSTIMIGIMIYTSVLERRKEIGVLRSLGARKKDISRVFIAESSMIGAYSGVIGIVISGILSAIVSAILNAVFGIPHLLLITWWHCLLMLLISILLSVIAGYIPSRIAANKDPAIALRSE